MNTESESSSMLIYLVAGARPNFMKIAPIVRALQAQQALTFKIIHTGQHYDRDMNEVFFDELGIPQPDLFMAAGGGSHAQQTAKIMIGFEELCMAAPPAAVLVVMLAFANSLVLICGLVFGIECFSLLFGPARDSSIPDLVGQEDVMTANSMMSTSTYLTMAVGTLIATVILGLASLVHKFPLVSYVVPNEATFQHEFAFIVDALTFLVSAMLLFTIAFPRKKRAEGQKFSARSIFSDLKEGLHFMRTDPLTRGILGLMIVGLIGGGSLYILGQPFAWQVLNSTGAKFTLLLSGLMIGVVVGAALTPWLSGHLPTSKWFIRAVIGFGITLFVFALIDFYPLSILVIILGGCQLGYLLVSAYTLLHQNLAEDIRGRVFAAMNTIMRTCLLISMGVFALIQALMHKWIPWTPTNHVHKLVNLGIFHKSFYPAMLALMIGAIVVIIGGFLFMRTLHQYFRDNHGGGEVEEAGAST